uniref:Polyprotein n=1 Tax=Oryza sativa subsp. japonica TaxID=39947 RepID=Q5W6X6_ORYSJ|nr:putative polyprotein [Oryza sativa Japonica Group]
MAHNLSPSASGDDGEQNPRRRARTPLSPSRRSLGREEALEEVERSATSPHAGDGEGRRDGERRLLIYGDGSTPQGALQAAGALLRHPPVIPDPETPTQRWLDDVANLVMTAQQRLGAGWRSSATKATGVATAGSVSSRRRARRAAAVTRRSSAIPSSTPPTQEDVRRGPDARFNIEGRRNDRRAAHASEGASSSGAPLRSGHGGQPPVSPVGGAGCRAFVASLRNVRWPPRLIEGEEPHLAPPAEPAKGGLRGLPVRSPTLRQSFMHKTPSEGKKILDRILENTSFMTQPNEPQPEASVSKIEEPLTIEPLAEPSTFASSIDEKVPEQPSVENEEIQTPDCATILFKDGFDEDYGNTLNYFSKRKPLVPLPPPDPMELRFLRETIRELTTIMSDEWLREAELSSEVIRINTAPRIIPCHLEGNDVSILYSPTVGANLVSGSFAFAYLSDKAVTPTNKFFKHPSGNIIKRFGIMQDVPVCFEDKEAILDFHVFEIQDFDILIGLPIEQLLINTPRLDSLKITLGETEFSIPFSRARIVLTDPLPEIESTEEVIAVPPHESPEALLEDEVPDFIKEEADPGETLDLPIMEPPPWPPLELKPLPPSLHYAFLHHDREAPVIISDKLFEDETQRLLAVLEKHCSVLGYSLQDLKGINPVLCIHRIPIDPESTPSREPQRRLNNAMREVVKKEVLKLLHAGIIYPVPYSEWVSPVQVVPKKGGIMVVANAQNELIPQRTVTEWRMCIDYRKLNKATKKDHFPLPFIDEMLERLANHSFFCFLDGYSGYHQIPIHPEDQSKTTFTCPYGTYAYRRMSFGLCNAPASFQRCMMSIFSDMIEYIMEVFMDDFLVYGKTFGHYLQNLDKVLQRCQEKDLVLNWEKCHFMVREGIVLGHRVSERGIEVDRAKIDVIDQLPPPVNIKGIRSFLGHASFYRRFIEDYSTIVRPLTNLLAKDAPFEFDDACLVGPT